jgi:hypothetical protein
MWISELITRLILKCFENPNAARKGRPSIMEGNTIGNSSEKSFRIFAVV